MNAFEQLYQTILARREQPQEGSYTCYLFEQGLDKILKKCGEECAETIIAAKNGNRREVVLELSDLAFHAAVLMAQMEIPPEEVAMELERRAQKTGNLKRFHQTDKNS
ncbi:MAG: phosphoribosyl-ATP diphosphatase [Oscillospiraceae bacterium]|jgi:phosphoribosyl-ATP pyrophosphohydrolase|nr:phosphoribosyl-ATP diphosphatase [Oscillospiraceae bacterium]